MTILRIAMACLLLGLLGKRLVLAQGQNQPRINPTHEQIKRY
jgi:hypothetical protein